MSIPTVNEVIRLIQNSGLKVVPRKSIYKVYDPKSEAWLFNVHKTPSDPNWYWALRRYLRRVGIISESVDELKPKKVKKGQGFKSWRGAKVKGSVIDLDALKIAQDKAAAAGEHIPCLEDIEDSADFFRRQKQVQGTPFAVSTEGEAIDIMAPQVEAPRLSYTKQRLRKFFEDHPEIKVADFARKTAEVAITRDLRAFRSENAASVAVGTFLKDDKKGLALWSINLIEATLDTYEGLKWGKMDETPTDETTLVGDAVQATNGDEVTSPVDSEPTPLVENEEEIARRAKEGLQAIVVGDTDDYAKSGSKRSSRKTRKSVSRAKTKARAKATIKAATKRAAARQKATRKTKTVGVTNRRNESVSLTKALSGKDNSIKERYADTLLNLIQQNPEGANLETFLKRLDKLVGLDV